MSQYFDDIQISNKGMVKLIRNQGRDYIFPASRILTVERKKTCEDPNSWIPVARGIFNLFRDDEDKDIKPDIVCIVTKDGYLYVNIPYTDQLYRRLDNARTYSMGVENNKYGTFT